MKFLSVLVNNIYLCWGIILVLLVSNVILLIKCSNLKKRRKLKDELVQIEQEVNVPKVEEAKTSEIDSIIEKIQKDMAVRPEQVIAQFEEEQEKNAIISYDELVERLKNNELPIADDEESEINFVEQLALESKQEPVLSVKSSADKSHLDVIDDLNEVKKFTSSEIISPVYGRMSDPKYPKMENYNNQNSLKLGENTMDLEPVTNEIKKNEDFLKNLVDFRNNL